MHNPNVLVVFEHERLRIGDGSFTMRHWKLLASWAESQAEKYLEVWSDSVRFLQWVGVLEVGDLIIEVLPKAELDRTSIGREEGAKKWRGILLALLEVAGYLDIHTKDIAQIELQYHTLLDILFERYLTATEELLREGLVKRYRGELKNRTAVRGRINYKDNIKRNLCHAERISTIATEYDHDNLPNKILKAAVDVSAHFAPSYYTRSHARMVALYFPAMSTEQIKPEHFSRIRLDNKSRQYKLPLNLAKLILSRQNPNLSSGSCQVFSLLFDMNALWEAAILARIKAECSDYHVRGQRSKYFWESHVGIQKTVRADIVAELDTGKRLILDTKWKVLTTINPADDDLKQIFVYDALWDAEDGFLVYPRVDERTAALGRYVFKINGVERRCGLLFSEVDPRLWPSSRLLDVVKENKVKDEALT